MKKMDEMEMSISLKSIRSAWFYTVVFLFIWMSYDFYKTRETVLPSFLLISQNIVLLASKLYFERKMNKDEE